MKKSLLILAVPCFLFVSIVNADPCTNESELINKFKFVKRQGNTLQVTYKNGKTHDYVSSPGDREDARNYCAVNYYPAVDALVLYESGYEWFTYHWLDRQTEKDVKVGEIIVFSPDKKRIVSIATGCGAASLEEFIGIWRVDKGQVDQEYFSKDGCANAATWIDNENLRVEFFPKHPSTEKGVRVLKRKRRMVGS